MLLKLMISSITREKSKNWEELNKHEILLIYDFCIELNLDNQ